MNDTKTTNGIWDAIKFFKNLTEHNKLALKENFCFCQISGLDGLEELLDQMQNKTAFVCVSDVDNGYITLENTPKTRRVKTIFLAMRHAVDNMAARSECLDKMRELFRQYMTKIIMERTCLEQNNIFIDPRISFTEINQYFAIGCACAYFQLAVDIYTDLRFKADDWE